MTRPPRLKVIHLITRLDLGGAQQNTLHTCRTLDPERFDCLLVAGEGGTLDAEAKADCGNSRLRFIPSLKREVSPAYDLLALLELANLFLAEKPDVVHTHSSKAGILGRLAAALAGVKTVVHTYHGFGFNDRQHPLVKALYVALERLCCRFTDRVVLVSKSNWEYALRHRLGRPESYLLLHSGVALGSFPARIEDKGKKKASVGIGMHKPLVVSIGNLKPQKNPDDFVSMAEEVHRALPDVRFLFIGEGPLRPQLESRLLREGLHGIVHFPGWRRDADELLAAADVFVLTSLWEGLPRSLVEAMKSGLPCACYDVDGVGDVLKDGQNGFLARAGDWRRLAERVVVLLTGDALRKKLGAAASASIGPEFDIDEMVRAQERLYVKLAAR